MPEVAFYKPVGDFERSFIYSPGPSLNIPTVQEALGKSGLHLAVGNAWIILGDAADIIYHSDAKWWNAQKGLPRLTRPTKISMQPTEHPDLVYQIEQGQQSGLEHIPGRLATGRHSGYAALNLAVQHGCREIYLLGYDMKYAPDKTENFCGNHPEGVGVGYHPDKFERFIRLYDTMLEPLEKLGVSVYNCTPGSELKCFPWRDIHEVT